MPLRITSALGTSATTLNVTGVTLLPGDSQFSIDLAGISLPVALAPGETLEVLVTFSPTAAGPASRSVEVASDDPDEPTVVASLSGNGTRAESPPSPPRRGRRPSLEGGGCAAGAGGLDPARAAGTGPMLVALAGALYLARRRARRAALPARGL